MNGSSNDSPNPTTQKIETFVIFIVTTTLCILAVECVTTQVVCVIYKIPDMNTTLSNAFMHITDTIIGALLGWTAKGAAQRIMRPAANESEITNRPDHPIPVTPLQPPGGDTPAATAERAQPERT
jgi:hypothetical protein